MKKDEHQRIRAFELWCWRRLLRVHWTARRSNQSILKEIRSDWIFIGRTDAEAEASLLWPPDVKSWLTGKDPDAGKDWRLKQKGAAEDEMVREHHWLNGHECEQTPGDSEGQRRLAWCSQTWLSNWTATTTTCQSGGALTLTHRAPALRKEASGLHSMSVAELRPEPTVRSRIDSTLTGCLPWGGLVLPPRLILTV